MIIWIIIVTIMLIYWFQNPPKEDKKECDDKYKKIFNNIKIPLLVACIIIFVYCNSNNKKQILDVDVGIVKF
jgi:hypothetical protein